MLTDVDRDVLRNVRDLIADRGRWTRGTRAKGASGLPVSAISPMAVKWCALGAIERLSINAMQEKRIEDALRAKNVEVYNYGYSVICVNDRFGHEAVLAVMDKVLADETIGDD